MVMRPLKKKKVVEEEVEEAETEEPVKEEAPAEEPQEDSNIVQVPVFLTDADFNRMIYENNVMLKRLLEIVTEEEQAK